MHQSIDIASNAKMIEVLKAEFIAEAADVFRASLGGSAKQDMLDTLGAAVLVAYALAKRCGISPSDLSREVVGKADEAIRQGHRLETNYNDLSLIKNHFESGIKIGFGQYKNKKA